MPEYIIDEHPECSIIRLNRKNNQAPFQTLVVEYLVWNDKPPFQLAETIHKPQYFSRDLCELADFEIAMELAHAMAIRFYHQNLESSDSTLTDSCSRFARQTQVRLEQAAQTAQTHTPQLRTRGDGTVGVF